MKTIKLKSFIGLLTFGLLTVTMLTMTKAMYANLESSRFTCDGRQYCSQMTSRAEAVFFINNCPNTKMDGDRDGVPCENDSRF